VVRRISALGNWFVSVETLYSSCGRCPSLFVMQACFFVAIGNEGCLLYST